MTDGAEYDREVDHYIWEGYYIRDKWDEPSDSVYATSREHAKQLVAEEADVENDGWQENAHRAYPLWQLHDTSHHIVTVVRRPVYGDSDE